MVKLNMAERIGVTNILPQQGDILTLRLGMQIAEIMYPTADEQKECEIKKDGNTMAWNEKGMEEKEIILSDLQLSLIKQELVKLNEAKTLTPAHISIFEKFMETVK